MLCGSIKVITYKQYRNIPPSYAKSQVFSSVDCQECLCLGAGQVGTNWSCPPCPCRPPAPPWSAPRAPPASTTS